MLLVLSIAIVLWLTCGTWWVVRLATRPPAEAFGRALAHDAPTDPGEAGLTFRTDPHTHAWHITGGTPDGPTVVLLHDWGGSPIDLLSEAAAHARGASTVILPTLRGHDARTDRCTLGVTETLDVQAIVDAAADPVHVYGSGLGGAIARGLDGVDEVHVKAPWESRHTGLVQILHGQGLPAIPLAWTARIALP